MNNVVSRKMVPHILIAAQGDDTQSIQRDLRELHFKVSTCTDSNAVLACLDGPSRPDLILMDRSLRGMDGLATCRLLRDTPRGADIPVVICDTPLPPAQRLAAFNAGAIDLIAKPYDRVDVLVRIQAHLAHHGPRAIPATDASAAIESSEDALLVRLTLRYLDSQPAQLLSHRHLAHRMGVSERRLGQAFRSTRGRSPRAAIQAVKLSSARQLLGESPLSISQIAKLLGYDSSASFSTAYRQHWGCSPSASRAEARAHIKNTSAAVLRDAVWAR